MGYFSGGHNRTHGYTGGYRRLDSFEFGKCIPLMEKYGLDSFRHESRWTGGGSVGTVLYPDRLIVGYYAGSEREEIEDTFYFATVPNNYGGADRCYFICPYCGRRARFLYLRQMHFRCRQCARLNYLSQQTSKGTDAAALRMRRFCGRNLR